jgi:uncharacterized membrane protein
MTRKMDPSKLVCQICKKQKSAGDVIPAGLVRSSIVEKIKEAFPDWSSDGYICTADLNRFRSEYVEEMIKQDKGEFTAIEEQVVKSLREHELLTRNPNIEYEQQLTFGERTADGLADFGGSWKFLGIFAGIIILWVVLNSALIIFKPFDPYPYILLNLVLSCLAAIQAPVIMMSQNRQESKDRLRAEFDYKINLKAELEIRHLHEKLDHLIMNQWQRLLEIQEIQTQMMEELTEKRSRS